MVPRKRSVLLLLSTLLVLGLLAGSALGGSYTVTVTATPAGLTELSIGAVEGCARFATSDLTDLGINNYRIYAGMSRVEPEDDDGVFGWPSISEIKANPNIINWAAWDYQFHRPDSYHWSAGCPAYAQTSLHDMLLALKQNNILPIITVRPVDNNSLPQWAQALNPPTTPEGRNEWWEFVFAWVYWANVRNNLEVHDWQVHNEPDNNRQGWGGNLADYIEFTRLTHDAIKYVYDTFLPGKSFRLYAPVSTHANEWITQSIIQNDGIIDVIDWHRYGPPASEAQQIHGWIAQYDSDGVLEPLYLSEWGSWRGQYNGVGDALNYAVQLADHNIDASYIAYSSIFPLYDWTSQMTGLVSPDGTRRETYWAFRLMTRGLQGGKQEYAVTHAIPSQQNVTPIAAKDQATGTLYVMVINKGQQNHTITLDLSAHAMTGTVTYRQYSASVKDAVTGTAQLSNGRVTFSLPKSTIVQVILN
jgi:hypothetical protein